MFKYFLVCLSVFFMAIMPSFSSCHVSDCDDTDFIELGKKFPSVGFFSSSDGTLGSGTLVDVGMPELSGRVIITCAHSFRGSDKEFSFTLGNNISKKGVLLSHPEFNNTSGKFFLRPNYDIALFILNEAIYDIPLASIGFDIPYMDLLGGNYISVGFGRVSHVFGKYEIWDLNKRASYAHAHASDNPREIAQCINPILKLCPYTTTNPIDGDHTLETFQEPAGISGSGDSGGGCFETNENKLIAIICTGSGRTKPTKFVTEREYFLTYQESFEQGAREYEEFYQSRLKQIEQNEPEKLAEFLNNTPKPGMHIIIEADEIEDWLKIRYAKEEYNRSVGDFHVQSTYTDVVVVSFHQNWIMNTLRSFI